MVMNEDRGASFLTALCGSCKRRRSARQCIGILQARLIRHSWPAHSAAVHFRPAVPTMSAPANQPASAAPLPAAATGDASSASSSQPCSCAPTVPLTKEWAAQAGANSTVDDDEENESAAQAASRAELSSQWGALLGGDGASVSSSSAVSPVVPSAPPVPAPVPAPVPLTFHWDRHVAFFSMHLKSIPQGYEGLDTSRMTMLYFCLAALDVLGAIETA